MSELTYTRCGDYYIPDLKLSEQPEAPIGKYGRMRRHYLKEHRPSLYTSLILSEKLYPHLLEIDRAARERMDAMLPRMIRSILYWWLWTPPPTSPAIMSPAASWPRPRCGAFWRISFLTWAWPGTTPAWI